MKIDQDRGILRLSEEEEEEKKRGGKEGKQEGRVAGEGKEAAAAASGREVKR